MTFCAAFLLYLHRFCLSYAQRFIQEDLGLTDEQLAYCFSAFFLAYALAQVPSGWLSDRWGGRRMLTVYILTWSLFTACMGLTTGFAMLIAVRIAAGLGQAGAYPTSAAMVGHWAPTSERGTANSVVAFGGRLGAGLAPILTVTLVLAFVPIDAASQLTPEDILDGPGLNDQFRRALTDRAAEAVRESADPMPGRRAIRRLGKALPATIRTAWRGNQQVEKPELVAALNAKLPSRDIFRSADFAEVPVEGEARRLATRDKLSLAEQTRLNRLRLEALFPTAIRKLYGRGWRPVMFVYGSLGILVAALYWFCVRDRPRDHPLCNSAERELIAADRIAASDRGPVGAAPIGAMLRSRSLWLMCINQWGGSLGWVFLVTWLPRYLRDVHATPFSARGWLAAIPLWAGWAGMLFGGWLTDRLTRRFGLGWRTMPIVIGRAVALLAYLSCVLHPSAYGVTLLFCLVAFSNDMGNPSSWAYKQDVGGRYVASIHGWANMWGNLGAAASPILLQWVIRRYGWDAAFVTCAGSFLVAGLAACGVDARIPIVAVTARETGRD